MNTLHKKNRWNRSIGIFFDFSTRLDNLRKFFKRGGKVLFFMAIICLFLIQTPIASGNDAVFNGTRNIKEASGKTLPASSLKLAQSDDLEQMWKENHPGYRTDEELYKMAYRALEMETVCVRKARMTCMLNLLSRGADDRILCPSYYKLVHSIFLLPESNQWPGPGHFKYARRMLLESLDNCYDDNCAYRELLIVHNEIHNSYAHALKLEGSAALGGGSTYSKYQTAYHAWVSKRQHSGLSVYSAWTPECNGDCDNKDMWLIKDFIKWLKSLYE